MESLKERKKIVKKFAENNTAIMNIRNVNYNDKHDYFIVKGETLIGSQGQKLQFEKKIAVKIFIDNCGDCLFFE